MAAACGRHVMLVCDELARDEIGWKRTVQERTEWDGKKLVGTVMNGRGCNREGRKEHDGT